MKKDLTIHFAFLLAYFLLIVLVKRWFDLTVIYLVLGGIVGTLLPDVDHFIYAYFLRPTDLTSQRARSLLGQRQVVKTWSLLAGTRAERTKLIFHTAYFQLIFYALALLVITSSGSLFGRGLVLAFSLHLFMDQVMDLMDTKNLSMWFKDLPFDINSDKIRIYMAANIVALCFLGFFL